MSRKPAHLSCQLLAAAALCGTLLPGLSTAQTWPANPIKIVVPSAPGTQSDIVARVLAQRLSPVLGQPVLIDNKPGADGMLAVESVVNAPADGYAMVNVQSGSLTIAPTLYGARMRYDPERDLAPVMIFLASPGARFITGQVIAINGASMN